MNVAECAVVATATAKQAGALLLEHFGKAQKVEQKSRTDFRTRADTASDTFIRAAIEKEYPYHQILSEELTAKETSSPFVWVVDPLDGTTGFVLGDWNFAVCIGLYHHRRPILGVIYAPKRDELYTAVTGKCASRNYRDIRVSEEENLSRAIIGVEPGKTPGRERKADMERKLLADDGVRICVTWASAATSLAAVAAGNLNGFISHKLEPWDMAAAVPILRSAGAKVTDLEGKEWQLGDESIVAANPVLHTKLLKKIKRRKFFS